MYDISRAHFHRVPVRRVFVELPDEETERLTREERHNLVSEKVHVWHSSGRRHAHHPQILKEREFFQGLSNPSWFVHVYREGLSFSKCDGKLTGKFHSDGNIAMEAAFSGHGIQWDATSGGAGFEADTRHVWDWRSLRKL